MLIAFAFGLVLSLSCVTGLDVGQSNLRIWDVDDSCKPNLPLLQKAYNDAAILAAKALKDIEFVQKPRPQDIELKERLEWDRIARAVKAVFGFTPDKQGTDPENRFLKRVLGVYSRMNKALHGDENIPANGFTLLHSKALLICGDTSWRWYWENDIDPYDPMGQQLRISQPQLMGKRGAWAYAKRYHANGNPNSIGICRPGVYAVTQTKYDMITFCGDSFTASITAAVSPVDGKNTVVEGKTHLDIFGQSLSRIMVHELAHWYGTQIHPKTREILRLPDQRAVSKRGELLFLYRDQNNKLTYTTTKPEGVQYSEPVVYYYSWVTKLALIHEGQFAENSGPERATQTAEAYAYFAMMAYLDNFDWSETGKAKHKEKVSQIVE